MRTTTDQCSPVHLTKPHHRLTVQKATSAPAASIIPTNAGRAVELAAPVLIAENVEILAEGLVDEVLIAETVVGVPTGGTMIVAGGMSLLILAKLEYLVPDLR